MNPKIAVLCMSIVCFLSLARGADPAEPSESKVVKMEPYVVRAKSLAQAGFAFKAKFRHHMIWAGIKELIIVTVEPRSAAKKAGLEVGEKIIQIRDAKVDGMGIRELIREFEKPSANGMISLTIQSKDSGATRVMQLQFHDPSSQTPEPRVPSQQSDDAKAMPGRP
jgi:predicted metalloprotease with PDZ domain